GKSSYPRKMFLTQQIDPAGNAVTYHYDASMRLTSITDAEARNTAFGYSTVSGHTSMVTRITDPFGRHADLAYDTSTTTWRLTSITDVLGITSSFAYDTVDTGFIKTLTTPYGTSSFRSGLAATRSQRWLEITDPTGATERVEYLPNAPGVAATPASVPAGVNIAAGTYALSNTFHWDKHAYAQVAHPPTSAADYAKAEIFHWLSNSQRADAPIIAATKQPLENYVFYNYPG